MTERSMLGPRGLGLHGDPTAKPFRPVQYLGSKVRLLDAIRGWVDSVDPSRGPIVDLFSGSGVVAAHLGRDRDVTAVDIQEYARVLAAALLSGDRMDRAGVATLVDRARDTADLLARTAIPELLEREQSALDAIESGDHSPLCEILEHGAVVAYQLGEGPGPGALADAIGVTAERLQCVETRTTLTRHYGGVYFGYRQALELDCLLAVSKTLPDGPTRDTALAASLGAASEAVTSVGNHFAQPIRPRDKNGRIKPGVLAGVARRRQRDTIAIYAEHLQRYSSLRGARYRAAAVRSDYRSFLDSRTDEVAVVYADPPYTRDHYSRFYHVLETMARGDDPDVSTVNVGGTSALSRGLYRRERHQSPFCIRSQAPEAFRTLFAAVRGIEAPLVVSYSPYSTGTAARPQPRLLTIAEIVEIAGESYRDITVQPAGSFAHSKLNAARLNGRSEPEAELFIVCRM